MAKKPKGFGEILHQQQWANASDRSFKKLKQKVGRNYSKDVKLIMNEGAAVKMSEVLENFISPYSEVASNKQRLEVLLSMGMLAWNIAIMPEETRTEMLDKAFASMMLGKSAADIAVGRDLVEQLIDRKHKFFADNQRMIISFELEYVNRGDYYISVASTMPS